MLRQTHVGTALRAFAHPTVDGYVHTMTIEELEKAVAELSPDDFARFRAWFEQFDVVRFDEKIERAARNGKLDRLADAAQDDLRTGRSRAMKSATLRAA